MAPPEVFRKSISSRTTRSTTKIKGPRKPRFSLPQEASESQTTLTQIKFVTRFRRRQVEEELLEYIEADTTASRVEGDGEEVVSVAVAPRSTAARTSTREKKVRKTETTKGRKSKKLEKSPNNKTLTQIGYVSRYQVQDIKDEEEMEYLREGNYGILEGETGRGEEWSGDTLPEPEPEPVRAMPRAMSTAKDQLRNQTRDNESDPLSEPIAEVTTLVKEPKSKKRKATDMTRQKSNKKRKPIYQDASKDAESDYADDESPKRRKRQKSNPKSNSQGPIASRLRPRNAHVSYVGNTVPKEVEKLTLSQKSRRTMKSKADVSPKPKTPVKSQRFEIPSSQSPVATPLSIRSRPPSRPGEPSPLRSPLTDLSVQSRLPNPAKLARSGHQIGGNKKIEEAQDIRFRNIWQTAGTVVVANVTNENVPIEDKGDIVFSSQASSILPDVETIFGTSRKGKIVNGMPVPEVNPTVEQRNSRDDDFDMGIETEATFGHLDRSNIIGKDELLPLPYGSQELPEEHARKDSKGTPEMSPPATRPTSTSPPWVGDNSFSSIRPSQPSKTLRQSQISTQGIPSSSLPQQPHESSLVQPSQHPSRILTQIWESSPSSCSPSPRPNDSHQDTTNIQTSPTKSPKPAQNVVESQPQAKDLTQIWESSDSSTGSRSQSQSPEIITASQLLPASLMQSLPRPPAWSQESLSDGDWV
jgi:hypothetical protein